MIVQKMAPPMESSLEVIENKLVVATPQRKRIITPQEFEDKSYGLADQVVTHWRGLQAEHPLGDEFKLHMAVTAPRGGLTMMEYMAKRWGQGAKKLGFICLQTYSVTGTEQTGTVELGQMLGSEDVEGKNIVLLDDINHTGKSQVELCRMLSDLGAGYIMTACMFQRPGTIMPSDVHGEMVDDDIWIYVPSDRLPVNPDAEKVFA